MEELLQLQNVTKRYGKKTALDNVSFQLNSGRIVGLLGPNASGKTTCMKLMNGLIPVDEGNILIDGFAPGIESKSMISFLPDREYLNNWMKVGDLLEFFADFYLDVPLPVGNHKSIVPIGGFDIDKAESMLKDLSIDKNDKLRSLSKGTKEKVQLILVMSRNAKLYLLDEPIGGVDPAARDYILDTILSNYSKDSTVLLSTHLIADVERIFDEVLFLKDGKLVLQKDVDEIREESHTSIDQYFREVFRYAR